MVYKVYYGKIGVIYNVIKFVVGIIIYKKVKYCYIEKCFNVCIEYIQFFCFCEGFFCCVKENVEFKKKVKVEGKFVQFKR